MERDQILQVVVKHMRRNLQDLEGREIDPSQPMSHYGASSLDIVEVVNASMRELKLRVPRTQLAGLKNIDGLVDTFHRVRTQGA
jgi:acyl carrier protein